VADRPPDVVAAASWREASVTGPKRYSLPNDSHLLLDYHGRPQVARQKQMGYRGSPPASMGAAPARRVPPECVHEFHGGPRRGYSLGSAWICSYGQYERQR
jgi:hypothetical protein